MQENDDATFDAFAYDDFVWTVDIIDLYIIVVIDHVSRSGDQYRAKDQQIQPIILQDGNALRGSFDQKISGHELREGNQQEIDRAADSEKSTNRDSAVCDP